MGHEEVWRWRRSRHLADGMRAVRCGAVRVGSAWRGVAWRRLLRWVVLGREEGLLADQIELKEQV